MTADPAILRRIRGCPFARGGRVLVRFRANGCHVRFQGLRLQNSTRFFSVPVVWFKCRHARWRAGTERRLIML